MTMRVNTIIMHCRAEEAFTLIEFIDQLRAMLIETYGDDIRAMLHEASQRERREGDAGDDEVF
jgi:hypothetical protein